MRYLCYKFTLGGHAAVGLPSLPVLCEREHKQPWRGTKATARTKSKHHRMVIGNEELGQVESGEVFKVGLQISEMNIPHKVL